MALKIGIIGCGGIGGLHADSYKKLGDTVEFTACCDIDEERAKSFAEKFGFARYYTDCREMCEKESLDGVSVCTWNSAHKDCTIAALECGINVLCEKPMAMNTKEALEMKAAADKAGKLLMIGFVRRHGNDAATAVDFIKKGYLGEVYYMKASYLRRAGFPGNWFGDKEMSGGGPLIDLGVHVIDLTRFLIGNPKPVTVFGVTYKKLGQRENLRNAVKVWEVESSEQKLPVFNVEDLAVAMIRFDNGAVLSVEASFSLNIKADTGDINLYGTKAGLNLGTFEMYTEANDMLADMKICGNTGCGDFFRNEMENFCASITDYSKCIAPADDGIELMRILDAIYESSATGKSVDIVR